MTSFMTPLIVFLCTLLTVVSAVPLVKRDVFVPPVTFPSSGDVLRIGQKYMVTWNASNPPAELTNPTGMIILAKGGMLLDFSDPLAEDFNILNEQQEITVPDVAPGGNYSFILFGDSGNTGPTFTITH
ncbi:uncharacterized protein PHACADRAFT_101536 [Phanerochaete carnosa HHB-10118-sp]|uniref:Uncharacterized protein n=1 Tax=Phanerochaete carnosa (strain HHB-10118-sp) TaxID=650164 RepID=K5WN75_PHACS|nr:uncharacterized protein PHACADRAFT_101536 [Phanerochaete carnosa HHB-10118-sp]EKM51772.1 hypothetical protein PHACADRAFT_101536 [Phanerochaete carnosa HHB-10118-sp]